MPVTRNIRLKQAAQQHIYQSKINDDQCWNSICNAADARVQESRQRLFEVLIDFEAYMVVKGGQPKHRAMRKQELA